MNYLIANNSSLAAFKERADYWHTRGLFFTFDYIEQITDVPGGWGCFKFVYPLPASKLFDAPDVEYRFSEEQNAWLADGQRTQYSDMVTGLYQYFVSREEVSE